MILEKINKFIVYFKKQFILIDEISVIERL